MLSTLAYLQKGFPETLGNPLGMPLIEDYL